MCCCSLGNLGDAAKAGGIHKYMTQLHEKHGPIVAFYWGDQQVVSLGSPDLWKDVQGLFDRPRKINFVCLRFKDIFANNIIHVHCGQKMFLKHVCSLATCRVGWSQTTYC